VLLSRRRGRKDPAQGLWFESRWGHGRLAQLGEHLPYKQGVACSSHAPPKGKAPVQGAFSLSGPATARGECKRFCKRFIRYEPVIAQLKGALRGRLRLEPTEPGGELVRLLLGVLVTPQQEGH
jgi:hypothetical protein